MVTVNPQKMAELTQVQERHVDQLMRKPHVVGVGVGLRCRRGEFTEDMCLVVMVDEKVPNEALAPDDRIPPEIDGVPVDVQETGTFAAL